MHNHSSLTVCIPTCGRLDRLNECVASVLKASADCQVLILSSGTSEQALPHDWNSSRVRILRRTALLGPSQARAELAANVQTEYLLFLDDDLTVLSNALDLLYSAINEHPDQIFAGVLTEVDGYREIGQLFVFGQDAGRHRTLAKKFVTKNDSDVFRMERITVDASVSCFMVATDTMQRVGFDSNYGFYFELFDFFMQCRQQRIAVNVIPNAVFNHRPGGYSQPTHRDADSARDRLHFENKWGYQITGSLGGDSDKSLPHKTRGWWPFKK